MSWAAVAIGVGTAAAGAYSSYSSNKQAGKALDQASQSPNYAADIRNYVAGIRQSMPGVLNLEQRYRNDYTGLNLRDVQDFTMGTQGMPGLLELSNLFTRKTGNQLEQARGREIGGMVDQTGKARNLLQGLSPQSVEMIRLATQDARQLQQQAGGLTGQEARSAQQFAREGAASRGRLMDNSAISAEILNRDNILAQKRAEASAATERAYNMATEFYSPGLGILSRTPQSYQAGQSMLTLGLGGIGSATPQMVDIGAGLNLGATSRQNAIGAAAANAQMNSANNAAMMNMLGSLGSSYLQSR